MGKTTLMQDSARADSGAQADWQACTTHAFLLDHRASCTVFRAIVVFAMTTLARSFTTHLTSSVVHRVRFGPDSWESGPNPAPDSPYLSIVTQTQTDRQTDRHTRTHTHTHTHTHSTDLGQLASTSKSAEH